MCTTLGMRDSQALLAWAPLLACMTRKHSLHDSLRPQWCHRYPAVPWSHVSCGDIPLSLNPSTPQPYSGSNRPGTHGQTSEVRHPCLPRQLGRAYGHPGRSARLLGDIFSAPRRGVCSASPCQRPQRVVSFPRSGIHARTPPPESTHIERCRSTYSVSPRLGLLDPINTIELYHPPSL